MRLWKSPVRLRRTRQVAVARRRPAPWVASTNKQAEIAQVLASVRSGRSAALVLRGEAGVGKTALVDDAVAGVADLEIHRLVGIESEMQPGFAGLHQLLLPFVDDIGTLPGPQMRALNAAFRSSDDNGAGLSGAAAALQIWAVTTALSRLDLPILGIVITTGQIVALVATVIYLCVSVHHYVTTYGKDPKTKDPTPSDALVAALTEALVSPQADDAAIAEAGVRANGIAVAIAKKVDDSVAQKSAPTGFAVKPSFARNLI
jgi:hypothetical protein